jgi:hypothetical protein
LKLQAGYKKTGLRRADAKVSSIASIFHIHKYGAVSYISEGGRGWKGQLRATQRPSEV